MSLNNEVIKTIKNMDKVSIRAYYNRILDIDNPEMQELLQYLEWGLNN